MYITILSIGILVFVAHLFTALFERTRIPDVLLLMLLGVIIGPVLHLAGPEDLGRAGSVLTTIALIVILFEGGTALDIRTIMRSAGLTLSITLSTFAATGIIASVLFVAFFDTSLLTGLMFGSIVGGTSSAVVLPMVRGLKMREPVSTVLILESSLTDVLCIVATFGLLEATVNEGTSTGRIIGSILSSFTFAVIIGIVGGHLWLFLLKRVRQFPNTIFTTFAFMFILYGLAEMLGYSGAISALAFGIALTNFHSFRFDRLPFLRSVQWERLKDTEQIFFGEIVFLLKVFFFVYLGISLRFDNLHYLMFGFLSVVFIYTARIFITGFFLPKTIDWFDAAVVSLMLPKGLAAAVLASLPAQYAIPEASIIQNVVYTVIFSSIILTAVMIPSVGRFGFYRLLFRSFADVREKESL